MDILGIPVYAVWLAAAIVFGIIEAVMLGLNSIWFSVGALAAMAAALLGGGVWVQSAVFLLVSLAALVVAKLLLKERFNQSCQPTNADRILGKTAVVTEEIDNERPSGQIRQGGMFWTARSIDGSVIPRDAQVTVKYIEGVKAMVERTGGAAPQ